MKTIIKVIIADDLIIVRNGIKKLLDRCPNISVVSEVSSIQKVLDFLANGEEADIILSDLNMIELNGIGLINKLNELGCKTKLVILTMFDQENYVIKAFDAGASGYLLKNLGQQELILAIESVYEGKKYICAELGLQFLNERLKNTNLDKERILISFNDRELEVLDKIAEGFTNNEIAEKLFLSRRTVEGHRLSLLHKTQSKNTAMLIRFAYINKYLS